MRSRHPYLIIPLLVAVVATPPVFADTVKLNIDKEKKYDKRVLKLKEGDTVVFKNGQSFKLGKFLGGGMENLIFALDKDHVIRIPNRSIVQASQVFNGARQLVALGVPIVNVEGAPLPEGPEYPEMEYVIAERIKPRFTLEEFLYKKGAAAHLSAAEEKAAADAFVKFAASTALFEYIGDGGPKQVIYTTDGRVVMVDWNQHHHPIEPASIKSEKGFLAKENVFSLLMRVAPGTLTPEEIRRLKLNYGDEFDPEAPWYGLNESDRWLKIKDRLQAAIDAARRKLYQQYNGDMKAAFADLIQKNLAAHQPLNYRPGAPDCCVVSEPIKTLIKKLCGRPD